MTAQALSYPTQPIRCGRGLLLMKANQYNSQWAIIHSSFQPFSSPSPPPLFLPLLSSLDPSLISSLLYTVPRAIVEWPPPEVQRSEGERLQFDCIASGRPVPTIVWLFQSTPVPVAPASTDSGPQDLGNGSLLIPSLHPLHAGTYFCMLEEPPLDIHTFTLTVVPRPSPLSSLPPSPTAILASAHDQNSTGSPPFTIGWCP